MVLSPWVGHDNEFLGYTQPHSCPCPQAFSGPHGTPMDGK